MNDSDIIVGIDFSEASKAALREAGHLANLRKVNLNLVHIIDIEFFENALDEKFLTVKKLKQLAESALRKIALEALDFPPPLNFHILVGHPFHEMELLMQSLQCNLLVLGSYGNNGSKDKVGTTAARFIREGSAPVLLVREKKQASFRTVVACHDFSETSQTALDYAAEITLADQADLHILHANLNHPSPYIWAMEMPVLPDSYFEDHRKEIIERVESISHDIKSKYPSLKVTTAVRDGHSNSGTILDYLREIQGDLTVLGTRGRTGAKKLLLGTTAEKVIHQSNSSVLAVKPHK